MKDSRWQPVERGMRTATKTKFFRVTAGLGLVGRYSLHALIDRIGVSCRGKCELKPDPKEQYAFQVCSIRLVLLLAHSRRLPHSDLRYGPSHHRCNLSYLRHQFIELVWKQRLRAI
jgi:hypothetical protein